MAESGSKAEKRPGFLSQIKDLISFTRKDYPWLPYAQVGVIVVGAALGTVLALFFQPTILGYVMWPIFGVLVGLIVAMLIMNRLATIVMYRRLDGQAGAAGHVVSNMLGRAWRGDEMPVGVNPKTQEAVYRAVGRGGIVLVGEGSRGRLKKLMRDENMKAKRAANGVPVHTFYVGHGEDDVQIKDLAKRIKALPRKIDRTTMNAVVSRLESLSQSLSSLPIPKGIDPLKARAPRPR